MLEVYPDIQPVLIGFIAGFFAATVLVGGVCAIWFWDFAPRAPFEPQAWLSDEQATKITRNAPHYREIPVSNPRDSLSGQSVIQDWGNGLGGH